MSRAKRKQIIISGNNKFENLELILSGWARGFEMIVIIPELYSSMVDAFRRIPFFGKYAKRLIMLNNIEKQVYYKDHKQLWYEINTETVALTLKFCDDQKDKLSGIIRYYNILLDTDKFGAHIKREVSCQLFVLLKCLHAVRLSKGLLDEYDILAVKTPINHFAVRYMEKEYGVKYRINWIRPFWPFVSLCAYYAWLCRQFLKRKIIFNRKVKKYKISMEAAWGFHNKTLRNDMFVDNVRFKKEDVLILQFSSATPARVTSFKDAKEKGFETVSVAGLGINMNRNIFRVLYFYTLTPLKEYLRLLAGGESHLFYYLFLFHKRSFPTELLLNLYDIKCHISTNDGADIAETIIFNKYGAKNILFYWSDLTCYRAYNHAFIAHNACYAWGEVHFGWRGSGTYSVDKLANIGCIYKHEYHKALSNKKNIMKKLRNLKKENKTVAFFDNSADNKGRLSVDVLLEYMRIIEEFCKRNPGVNVLLKRKNDVDILSKNLRGTFWQQYKEIWENITACDNFNCCGPSGMNVEEVIAISDACVTLSMSTPSTVGLICGKNSLYFDSTGNTHHPFMRKYKDIIVFDDMKLLFEQIDKILKGQFDCAQVISEREIRQYDGFDDSNALERLKDNVYELTGSRAK